MTGDLGSESRCRRCKAIISAGAKKCNECGEEQDWRRHFQFSSTILALLVAIFALTPQLAQTFAPLFRSNTANISVIPLAIFEDTNEEGEEIIIFTFALENNGFRDGVVSVREIHANIQVRLPGQYNTDIHEPNYTGILNASLVPSYHVSQARSRDVISVPINLYRTHVLVDRGFSETGPEYQFEQDQLESIFENDGLIIGPFNKDNISGLTECNIMVTLYEEDQVNYDDHIEPCWINLSPDFYEDSSDSEYPPASFGNMGIGVLGP